MRFSIGIIRTTLLILAAALLNPSIQANAYWTRVSLRIEGSHFRGTIFEGTVLTSGHIVTTASGGTHECDGTNNGAHTTPGATIISAIDDAVSEWDGSYNKGTRDYFITSIDGDEQTNTEFWGLLVGYKFTDKGGCQSKVTANDQVLIAFDAFGTKVFLEASTKDPKVEEGKEVVFTVVNGADKKPVGTAMISALGTTHTAITNADGKATIKFTSTGVFELKGTKGGTIRSNKVVVTVTPAVAPMTTAVAMAEPGSQTVYLYDAGFKGCNQ